MTLPRWQILAKKDQRALFRLMASQDAALRDALTQAARNATRIIEDLPSEGIGAAIRRAFYLQRQSALIRELSRELWLTEIQKTMLENIARAGQLAIQANENILSMLLRATPKDAEVLARSFLISSRGTLQNVRSRMLNNIQLSPKVYKGKALMDGKIDLIVNDGIALGQSAAEIASSVKGYINPRVMGGVRNSALRLGRTELNNAFRTTSKLSYIESPYVRGVQWELSGSHPDDDDCNELAEADDYGLGTGVYPPAEVPDGPHPNCFCYYVPITPSNAEFVSNLRSGVYAAA